MLEDESISDFNIRLHDIANNYFALGENMSEEKLDRQILRSLPHKLDMKVTTIEEAQDLMTFNIDELILSLQTFVVYINGRYKKKNKGEAFVSNTQENEDQSDKDTKEIFL